MCRNFRLCYRKLTFNLLTTFRRDLTRMSTLQLDDCIVAVGQLCSTNDKKFNIESVEKIASKAVDDGAKMLFLPEGTDYIADTEEETLNLAETIDGCTVSSLRSIAETKQIWLSVGLHEKCTNDSRKIYNTHIIINDGGEVVGHYRKMHLFDVVIPQKNINLQESKFVDRGMKVTEPVSSPAGNIGMLICYDVRFPEISTTLRKMNASLLTYPSAFTHTTGEAHWKTLLQARAIENQCYVIAAAQIGHHNEKRFSHGHSMIIDPWGRVLAELPKYHEGYREEGSFVTATIKKDYVDEVRLQMPVFHHRRNDIYNINIESSIVSYTNCDMFFSDKVIPADTIFYRSKLSFAFTNIRCVVPGHVLICSRRIVPKICDLTNEEIADLFQTVIYVQKTMEKIQNVQSTTLVVQDGIDAGQTVPHVHCHILPRRPGDFQENDQIYDALAKHDKPDTMQKIRDVAEMIDEARQIRCAMKRCESLC